MALSLRPTVVIGFGTSGAKIIEGIQQLMYEMFKRNSLPIFQFISIETDKRYVPENTPIGSDIDPIILDSGGPGSFDNFNHLLEQLKRDGIEPDWVNPELLNYLVAKGEGAGNARVVGRLILWANMDKVYNSIQNAKQRASDDKSIDETREILADYLGGEELKISDRPMAITCGTTTGGSFSGAFIDLGYICKEAMEIPDNELESLFSLLLLPPKEVQSSREQLKANAYGALYEWEYFVRKDTEYQAHWPKIDRQVISKTRPYGYIYLISQEYGGGGNSIRDVEGLYELSALKLFTDIIGFEGARGSEIVNHFQQGRPEKLTFGLAAIMHPRYLISEYTACNAAIQLIERWLDKTQFIKQDGQAFPMPNIANLISETSKIWEGTETNAFNGYLAYILAALELREPGSPSLRSMLEEDIKRLIDDENYNIERKFLDTGNTYYGILRLNIDKQIHNLKIHIQKEIYSSLEKTQNIPFSINYARAFQETIKKTLEYWKRIGIPETYERWQYYVTKIQVPEINKVARSGIEQVKNLFTTRYDLGLSLLLDTVEALKKFLLFKPLQEVQEWIEVLIQEELIQYSEMLKRARERIKKRRLKIKTDLEDTSLPIARVWARGNMESDLRAIEIQNPDARHIAGERYNPEMPTYWMIENLKKWYNDDKRDSQRRASGRIASERIKGVFQEMAFQKIERELKINLLDVNYQDHIDRYFRRVQRCHLRYDHYGKPIVVTRYLIGRKDYTQEMLKEVYKQLREEQGIKEKSLPNMDHMVLFYKEEAFSSFEQLKDFEGLKKSYTTPPRLGIDEDIKSIWSELRIAYNVPKLDKKITSERLRKQIEKQLRQLFMVVSELFVIWSNSSGTWQPLQIREGVELPISVAPHSSGAGSTINWTVSPELRTPEIYSLLDSDGKTNYSTIRQLAEKEVFAKEMLEKGLKEVQRLGTEKIKQFWDESLNGQFSAREYLTQRFGADFANKRADLYFGAGDNAGLIEKLMSVSSWPEVLE